jgi:hypothetical protein
MMLSHILLALPKAFDALQNVVLTVCVIIADEMRYFHSARMLFSSTVPRKSLNSSSLGSAFV